MTTRNMVRETIASEQPAQRSRRLGVEALTNAELLTIICRFSDMRIAENILARFNGSLRRLSVNVGRATEEKGFGKAAKAQVEAAFEFGRRFCAESREENAHIRSPRDVVAIMAPRLEDLPVEEFHVLILDAHHRFDRDVTVTRGILNSSLVHPREVFREAIAERAAAIHSCAQPSERRPDAERGRPQRHRPTRSGGAAAGNPRARSCDHRTRTLHVVR